MLFADDTALASHTQEGLQRLIKHPAHACKEFGLTISLKKTKVMRQDASEVPSISIRDYTLEVVEDFTHLGSLISNNLSLEAQIGKRNSKAASSVSRLSKRVWENDKLTMDTKILAYNNNSCVLALTLWQRNLDCLCLVRTSPR